MHAFRGGELHGANACGEVLHVGTVYSMLVLLRLLLLLQVQGCGQPLDSTKARTHLFGLDHRNGQVLRSCSRFVAYHSGLIATRGTFTLLQILQSQCLKSCTVPCPLSAPQRYYVR